jgi:Arc/MetJ family transcription regulator
MRTNIVLDDKLIQEAFSYSSNIKTKRELIEVALKEYVSSRKVKDLRDLRGKIQFDENYDHKKMRTGE